MTTESCGFYFSPSKNESVCVLHCDSCVSCICIFGECMNGFALLYL
jgi:hypothetical protein